MGFTREGAFSKELYCQPDITKSYALSLSPDGRNLIFGTTDETNVPTTLWIIPSAGGNASKLITVESPLIVKPNLATI